MLTANLMRRPFNSGCHIGPLDTVMAEKNGLLLHIIVEAGGHYRVVFNLEGEHS
ncbi:hypothetical protein JI735_17140 [Paenibacillus sonchi]|uniref:Uncharacterized protein n=1 Tax=Paenibacillus sonchi TaxID=373687 RepID=A0A974P726_9BACL|nr:hypothetical protein JI735_17140 [Paenibacillus sonchi]